MGTLRNIIVGSLLVVSTSSCRDDGDDRGGEAGEAGSPDQVGSVCEVPDDCYSEVAHEDLSGDVICMERVRDGYCTHLCATDDDCCAVEGECLTDWPQVCAPFESTGMMMCFLSCESADWEGAGAPDEQTFCQHEASPDFVCRSTGGGALNRKVCVPGDCGVGASCRDDADCDPDLDCIGDFDGGYCGRRGCTSNAECPAASICVGIGDEAYCVRTCDHVSDCGFCRHPDIAAECTTDVEYLEGATVPVCVP
jgi:hypothetical protein